jgi:hypothetical protein
MEKQMWKFFEAEPVIAVILVAIIGTCGMVAADQISKNLLQKQAICKCEKE